MKRLLNSPHVADALAVFVLLLYLFVTLIAFTGCASVHQLVTATVTDPQTGLIEERRAETTIRAAGDAKQAIEKLRSSNGKTQTLGASGVSEETNVDGLVKLLEALGKLKP